MAELFFKLLEFGACPLQYPGLNIEFFTTDKLKIRQLLLQQGLQAGVKIGFSLPNTGRQQLVDLF